MTDAGELPRRRFCRPLSSGRSAGGSSRAIAQRSATGPQPRAAGVSLHVLKGWVERSREKRPEDAGWFHEVHVVWDSRRELQQGLLEDQLFHMATQPKETVELNADEQVVKTKIEGGGNLQAILALIKARGGIYTPKERGANVNVTILDAQEVYRRLQSRARMREVANEAKTSSGRLIDQAARRRRRLRARMTGTDFTTSEKGPDDLLASMDFDTWETWWENLTDEERTALSADTADAPRVAPQPGPQTLAYNCEAKVTGYGGSAGGGKTALAAILALNAHHRSVIFRFDKTQLSGMMDDVVEFYGSDDGLNRQGGVFRFADRLGHMMEFGGIGGPREERKWQGRPHDLIVFDEATEIGFRKFKWLKTWNRSTVKGQRCRIVLTFNPPGGADDEDADSGRWVIDYFAPWLDERHENPGRARRDPLVRPGRRGQRSRGRVRRTLRNRPGR